LSGPWGARDPAVTARAYHGGGRKELIAVFTGSSRGFERLVRSLAGFSLPEPGAGLTVAEETPVLRSPDRAPLSSAGGALRVTDSLDLSWEAYGLMGRA